MSLYSFINKYYLEPIKYDSGYNIFNTITYALLFFVIIYVIYAYVKKIKINIDFKFFLSLLPFAFFGAVFRAFVDHGFYTNNVWTITPGLYIITIGAWLCAFSIAHYVENAIAKTAHFNVRMSVLDHPKNSSDKPHTLVRDRMNFFDFKKQNYWKHTFVTGAIISAINIIIVANKMQFENVKYGLLMITLAAISSLIIYFIFKYAKQKWALTKLTFVPFVAHMLDASATFVAVDFLGGFEKHPLPRLLSELFHTAAIMYALKLVVLIPGVYFITKDVENKQVSNMFLIAIATLGFAQGVRDILTMILV